MLSLPSVATSSSRRSQTLHSHTHTHTHIHKNIPLMLSLPSVATSSSTLISPLSNTPDRRLLLSTGADGVFFWPYPQSSHHIPPSGRFGGLAMRCSHSGHLCVCTCMYVCVYVCMYDVLEGWPWGVHILGICVYVCVYVCMYVSTAITPHTTIWSFWRCVHIMSTCV